MRTQAPVLEEWLQTAQAASQARPQDDTHTRSIRHVQGTDQSAFHMLGDSVSQATPHEWLL